MKLIPKNKDIEPDHESTLSGEQSICIICGFCCDGTLFNNAVLDSGEKGNLPEKIEFNYFIRDNKEYFRLPCLYFDGKCTIYDQKKAIICSAFRCKLLRDFAKKEITEESAFKIIENANNERKKLFHLFHSLSGNQNKIYLKELMIELNRIDYENKIGSESDKEYKYLVARCHIFEALLTRHFRSTKEFNDLMESPTKNNDTQQ